MVLELKDATGRCEFLEKVNKTKAVDLDKALQEAREARSESRALREEVRQAKEIVAGKPFLLQTKFGDPDYAQLNQVWSSSDEYLDLPKSSSDAARYYQAQAGYAMEKLFCHSLARQSALCCSMNRCPNGPNFIGYLALP